MYFYYGIKNSTLEESSSSENVRGTTERSAGNIELKVTEPSKAPSKSSYPKQDCSIYESHQELDAFGQPVFGSTNFGGTPNPTSSSVSHQGHDNAMFDDPTNFPSWDD